MKAEYDFRKGRRGVRRSLPPRDQLARHTKVRISIMLDGDVLDFFKSEATRPGALPYQTRINQVLRAHIERGSQGEAEQLLKNEGFIEKLAEVIEVRLKSGRPTSRRRAARKASR